MATPMLVPIVVAAGRGRRVGADKALLAFDGATLIERLVTAAAAAGLARPIVVRRADQPLLPDAVRAAVNVVVLGSDGDGEMLDSLRAGIAALPPGATAFLSFPVDHGLVHPATLALLAVRFANGATPIVLPLFRDRPGHPIVVATRLAAEVIAPDVTSLRDVIRRDPARVTAVAVDDAATRHDLDTDADVEAARDRLRAVPATTVEVMRAHRTHRGFRPDPIDPRRLARLVDAARYASTSSFIQAYAVVVVTDPVRKAEAARLCADQPHIHEAPVFLAICADLHKLRRSCERHGQTLAPDSLELFVQASVDASLLGQNLLLAAESEGLGGCMLGAARDNPVELARHLGLPPQCYVVFGLSLGVPADDPIPRGRLPLPAILHVETYDRDAVDEALDGGDEGMRAWARRTNEERGGYGGRPIDVTKGWTDRMAQLWSREKRRPNSRDQLRERLGELGFEIL